MSKSFRLSTAIICAGVLTLTGATSAFAKTTARTAAKTTTKTTYSMSWSHSVSKVQASSGGFSGISCAALNLCVGVDGAGDVIWSTTPTRANGNAWRIASVDASGGGLTGISCPSKKLCVAVDATGEVIWSTTPNGGVSDWSTPVRIDSAKTADGSYVGLSGIACPSTTLCVAVDSAQNGGLLVSRNPTGGASTWRRTTLGSGAQLTAVSCPSTTLCVVTGNETFSSTTPMGAASAWKQTNTAPSGGMFSAIGCMLATTTCLTVGYGSSSSGFSYGTSTVSATTPTWTASAVEATPPTAAEGLIDAVACPAKANFCVAVDSVDNVFTTNTPVRGHWSAPSLLPGIVDTSTSFASGTVITCTQKICVVADSNGYVTGGNVIAKTVKVAATTAKQAAAKKAAA